MTTSLIIWSTFIGLMVVGLLFVASAIIMKVFDLDIDEAFYVVCMAIISLPVFTGIGYGFLFLLGVIK